jgi:hypothetical protein
MRDIRKLSLATSHPHLNKHLLAGMQLDDPIDSSKLLYEYIAELHDTGQITLDEVRKIYYEHFRVDKPENLPYHTLVACGVFGFEIDRILKTENQLAKLKLVDGGYALEELSHDSDKFVKNRAKLFLYQKEREAALPEHFKIICSQLNKKQVGCQLAHDESLLITIVNDMFDGYTSDLYAKVDYNEFTNAYMYSIKFCDAFDYNFTYVDAARLFELEVRFAVRNNQLDIYTNDDVDVQRVIDVLKFFFEEYL